MTDVELPFFFVDVFAREPLSGNPLALVPNADAIDVARMKAIAQEFNQSETTFLLRPTAPTAHWRLRSFTAVGVEVLGAGHNAMGAWIWLAQSGELPADQTRFRQEIGDDVLAVEVTRRDGDARHLVTMDQSAPQFAATVIDRAALASALGLDAVDLAPDDSPQVVSTGVGHLLVPLHDRTAVDRATPDSSRLLAVLRDAEGEGCYVYTRDAGTDAVAYARFFNPTVGIVEDPATGTAAGPLAARLVDQGHVAAGAPATIEQGTALGRPSRLEVTVDGPLVRLSGSGVLTASGTLHLPARS
ncbi:PhzF family phenazine biosynthesis protein [uncultured Microbacterium sp.]|uniref:PhzF family phenazine biosynthesis protein n=1 Tax=uncultured Microbacterium sp. TaxID=191216 RepID=UPI0035CAD7E7